MTEGHDIAEDTRDPGEATGAPGRRKRRLWAAGILVAVLLLLVVPAIIAAQPGFYRHVTSLEDEYGPWSKSTHLEAGCEGCHASPRPLARLAYRIRMAGQFYLTLAMPSRTPGGFETPTHDACLECHNDLRTVSPAGDLQIPHRAHVSILKMECVECHSYLVHALSPEGKHTPPMEGCLECHDGDTAKDDCWACHTEKAAPPTHSEAGWLVVHADHATDPECETCHEWRDESWCADCHAHRPRSHTSDWRAVHGERVKEQRGCEACHTGDFCVRCHGEVPQENFDPTLEVIE